MKKLISFLLILAVLLPCAFASAYYDETDMGAVLDALDKNSYKSCYAALLEGDILEKGASGDNAKALQRVLKAFGEDVSTDGKAGSGTFKVLNKVQKRYGMEQTDYVDAEIFAELLCALYVYQDGEKAEDAVIAAGFPESEYLYCLARYQASSGHYYLAKQSYEASGWADWADRADSCVKDWPKDGRVWKSSSIGSGVTVKFKVKNADSDEATCFKIYNSDDKLVAVLFIGGNGSAQTSLKAGRYTIKQGNGHDWYGRKDAFGEDGWYVTWTFDGGADSYKFKSGYIYTLTTGVSDGNAGSNYENWGNF